MKYYTVKYGNKLNLEGKCLPERERDIAIKKDKDQFVRIALRLRRRKKQIKSFDNYVVSLKRCEWTLDITATTGYHKRMHKMLTNPEPILRKWREQDEKAQKKALKKMARHSDKKKD